jgi:hypothetical protein
MNNEKPGSRKERQGLTLTVAAGTSLEFFIFFTNRNISRAQGQATLPSPSWPLQRSRLTMGG